jgi:hypothetical protein
MGALSRLLIGIAVFSFLAIGVGLFYADLADTYGHDNSDLAFFNRSQEIQEDVDSIKDKIEDTPLQGTIVGDIIATTSTGYEALRIGFSSINLVQGISQDVAGEVQGIPDWVIVLIPIILTLVVVFTILHAIMKVDS